MNICKAIKYANDYINYYYLFGIGLPAMDKRSGIHKIIVLMCNGEKLSVKLATNGCLCIEILVGIYKIKPIFKESDVTNIELDSKYENRFTYWKFDKKYVLEINYTNGDYYCNYLSKIPKNIYLIKCLEECPKLGSAIDFACVDNLDHTISDNFARINNSKPIKNEFTYVAKKKTII